MMLEASEASFPVSCVKVYYRLFIDYLVDFSPP